MKKVFYLLFVAVIVSVFSFNIAETSAKENLATRAEAIVEIAKKLNLDGTQRETQFKDVPRSHWASGYIQSAVDLGIVSGYSDGTFRPSDELTRAHMAVFISRAFGPQLPKGDKTFKDVTRNNSAYSAIQQLVAANVTSGYPDGTFKPDNKLTRTHLDTFIDKTYRYIVFEERDRLFGRNGNSVNSNNYDSIAEEYGALKGTVTWQYNQYIGTRADVDARIFMIPTNYNYKNHEDAMSLFVLGIAIEESGILSAKANGYGQYEISDIPVGEYFVIIASKNTRRNPDEPIDSYLKTELSRLIGADNSAKFERSQLLFQKHTYSTIKIEKDRTKDFSRDFGYTYF
ncbi:S-layer homology domain-containing protein [Bacillus ndiopicus]|uniref:S-layer homology domain-containing protein n=1 Tax=Bacillus ndiopicus TaxID=1347368 RepID=UPI0006934840|nr:S-layer homology domain-containing protein [Bacillus ndiopicus]